MVDRASGLRAGLPVTPQRAAPQRPRKLRWQPPQLAPISRKAWTVAALSPELAACASLPDAARALRAAVSKPARSDQTAGRALVSPVAKSGGKSVGSPPATRERSSPWVRWQRCHRNRGRPSWPPAPSASPSCRSCVPGSALRPGRAPRPLPIPPGRRPAAAVRYAFLFASDSEIPWRAYRGIRGADAVARINFAPRSCPPGEAAL